MVNKVAILQSNYIPWRGYFDIIRSVDSFVFYDEVQYTKNDWRNRNLIVSKNGPQWLSLPVRKSGRFGQTIAQAEVSLSNWARKHITSLQTVYGGSSQFGRVSGWLFPTLEALGAETNLSYINQSITHAILNDLEIKTKLYYSQNIKGDGDRNVRLVKICTALGATHYVSGPAARDYLDVSLFESHGIQVEWFSYPDYSAYKQLDGSYRPAVSIIDTLFHLPCAEVMN